MNNRVHKSNEKKALIPASRFVQRSKDNDSAFQFVDNRPEALQLKRLRETINKQSTSSVLQCKAGVVPGSFQVQWRKHPDDDGKNAAHQIGFRAKFEHGGEFDAHHAEFRQQVESFYDIVDEDGESVANEKTDMHDDGYSRAADPHHYSGVNSEIFSGADLAGFHEGASQLDPTDDIYYEFTALQQIVDTSDNDNVIAEVGPRTETIWGSHPRKYSILGDK